VHGAIRAEARPILVNYDRTDRRFRKLPGDPAWPRLLRAIQMHAKSGGQEHGE
jgi:hypothetical protein